MTEPLAPIVVGFSDDAPDTVALVAAELASRPGAALVFVAVDETRYTTTDREGDPVELPIDPDAADDAPLPARSLDTRLRQVLRRHTAVDAPRRHGRARLRPGSSR